MRPSISNGCLSFTGINGKLRETMFKIALAESRLWLMKNMLSKNLMTRDILFFVTKQADMRIVNKDIDLMTVKAAMAAKLEDIKWDLENLKSTYQTLKSNLLNKLDGRMFKLKKILSRLSIEPKKLRRKSWPYLEPKSANI